MENEQTTVETADNSSASEISQEDIMSVLDEPEGNVENAKSEPEDTDNSAEENESSKDNTQQQNEYPTKFKNEDGTINYDNLLKSYKELEPLLSQKAQWEKERAELLPYKEQYEKYTQQQEEAAKQQGFDSALDMEQQYALVSLEANEYAKYLRYTEDPEATRAKLLQYLQNPSDELLSDIEFEFPTDVVKNVTLAKERQRQQYQNQAQVQAETQMMSNIENVINESVEAHNELFEYEPFRNLFVNTLHRFGDNFTKDDALALMETMVQMKELFRKEFANQSDTKNQNTQATDKLSGMNVQNSAPAASQKELDISKMTDKQLVKYLKDFV